MREIPRPGLWGLWGSNRPLLPGTCGCRNRQGHPAEKEACAARLSAAAVNIP